MNFVVRGVEGPYRVTVEHPRGQCEGQFRPALGMKCLAGIGSMVAAKKDAPKVLSGKTVEPRHGVFKAVVAFAREVEKRGE